MPSLELNYYFNNHGEEAVLPGTSLSASLVSSELSSASEHHALLSKIPCPDASVLPLTQRVASLAVSSFNYDLCGLTLGPRALLGSDFILRGKAKLNQRQGSIPQRVYMTP